MAAPYLAGSGKWLVCTPIGNGGPVPGTGPTLGVGTVLAVNVAQIVAITDNVDHYDANGAPVMGVGVNLLANSVGRWVTIEGTRANVATLLGIA